MAAKTFRCKLITPEARVLDEDCTYVQLPLHDGQAGILPMRAPLMAKIGLGELRVDLAAGGSRSYLIEDGFAQMVGDSLTLLAERAAPVESLSEEDARAELAAAESRKDVGDVAKLTRERDRARAKLTLAQRFRATGGKI
jgi:F-type H+-transporting ATPase subunit epsilon